MSTIQDKRIQDKRDGLELAVLFKTSDPGGQAILHRFEGMLSEYLFALLNPKLSDADALFMRAKAIALVDTLNDIGQTMTEAEKAPISKVARMQVRESLNWHDTLA
jgi:hypothetical protein